MKRLMIMLVCFLMVWCCGVNTSARAEGLLQSFFSGLLGSDPEPEIYESGDFRWSLLEDGSAEIRRYTGKKNKVVIPDQIEGHPVTRIGEGAFSGKERITSIVIPEGVTAIAKRGFSGCYKLGSIELPESVKSIGYQAFASCINLTRIKLSPGLESIEESAFVSCDKLKSLELPEGVKSIGDTAFL